MKIIIFGLGSIGKRHAKILQENFRHEIIAFRRKKSKRGNELGIKEVDNWNELKEIKPDAAWITNPTFMHIPTALKCASMGMHLFIEKPLSNSMKDVDLLGSICRKNGLTCYVAYCLRFHPVIMKIRRLISDKKIYHVKVVCSTYLPEWRKGTNHLKSYSASAGMGGGALLDLSHEFDYIEYLFGKISEIRGNYGRVSTVTIDAQDFADVICKTGNSVYVNLHLNLFSKLARRELCINFKNGYILGDLINNTVLINSNGKRRKFRFATKRDDYLKAQTRYFLRNIGNKSIMNNLTEAKRVLRKIIEFKNG